MVLLKKILFMTCFTKSKIKQKQREEMNGFFFQEIKLMSNICCYIVLYYEVVILYIYIYIYVCVCVCILACHAYMYTYICATEKVVRARAYRAGNVAPPLSRTMKKMGKRKRTLYSIDMQHT